jgi:S1-C subfamily serine protease
VQRPWLGASLQVLTPEIAESLGLDRPAGALVADVSEAGPAGKAGLASGDVVLAIDGTPISDPDDFGYRFATKPLGGAAAVDILRGGKHVEVRIPLAAASETRPRDEAKLGGPSPLSGATVANLSPAIAEALGLRLDAEGVVLVDVEDGTVASSLGFQKKDIVLAVNGQPVQDAKALGQIVREPRPLWRITIDRDGRQISSIFGG